VSSGQAEFAYYGQGSNPITSNNMLDERRGEEATFTIKSFNNFRNFEGLCGGVKQYIYLSQGTLPALTITVARKTDNSIYITVNIGIIRNVGIDRVIIGYHRLDLGQPVVGQYVYNGMTEYKEFTSLVPGAKYRITAWGLSGSSGVTRSRSPAVVDVAMNQQSKLMKILNCTLYTQLSLTPPPNYTWCTGPSPPRDLIVTRVFQHGIELNWIPPLNPNGPAHSYIITYITEEHTEVRLEFTSLTTQHFNLTGLEQERTYYNITLFSVNTVGTSRGITMVLYYHLPIGLGMNVSSNNNT
jgi:hypothetical protein